MSVILFATYCYRLDDLNKASSTLDWRKVFAWYTHPLITALFGNSPDIRLHLGTKVKNSTRDVYASYCRGAKDWNGKQWLVWVTITNKQQLSLHETNGEGRRLVGDTYQPAPGSMHLIHVISFKAGKEAVQDAPPAHKPNTETEACSTEEIKRQAQHSSGHKEKRKDSSHNNLTFQPLLLTSRHGPSLHYTQKIQAIIEKENKDTSFSEVANTSFKDNMESNGGKICCSTMFSPHQTPSSFPLSSHLLISVSRGLALMPHGLHRTR